MGWAYTRIDTRIVMWVTGVGEGRQVSSSCVSRSRSNKSKDGYWSRSRSRADSRERLSMFEV